MANITVTLPENFAVTSRGKSVNVRVDQLNAEIVAQLVLHGLTQKVSDSAASATKEAIIQVSGNEKADAKTYAAMSDADKAKVVAMAADIGLAWMDETRTNLEKGIWGATRVAGAGVTPLQSALRAVCRGLLVASFDDKAKAKWKDMDSAARNAKLDEVIAKQTDEVKAAWTKEAEQAIADEAAKKARAAKLAGKFDIAL